ncbi:MAG: hypothetical protein LAT61_10525 [Alcanivorax sp.]|nr:hypothetical protein [Alcanivorax sp.]
MALRDPAEQEIGLIMLLLNRADIECDWLIRDGGKLTVEDMSDRELGGLRIRNANESCDIREPVRILSELTFKGQDGVDVVASLYIDQAGNIVALDMWKTDFSALIAIPDIAPDI